MRESFWTRIPRLPERRSEEYLPPRYAFIVLYHIAQASDQRGAAGSFIRRGAEAVPVRDRICDALSPMGRRAPNRLDLTSEIRKELARKARNRVLKAALREAALRC